MTTLDLTLAELEYLIEACARQSGAPWRRAPHSTKRAERRGLPLGPGPWRRPAPAGLADKLDAALDAADEEETT